jgi:hypothetical protein
LWVIFAFLDPDTEYGSGSTDLIESGSVNLKLIRIFLLQIVEKSLECPSDQKYLEKFQR